MEGRAIENNGTRDVLLEETTPADNSHFQKSRKDFQESGLSYSISVSSVSSSNSSARKELMELFDRIQREVINCVTKTFFFKYLRIVVSPFASHLLHAFVG